MSKTDYFGHDEVYKRLRSEGREDWATNEQIEEFTSKMEEVFCWQHFPAQGKLLELGCGAGANALWLAKKGYDVHGVDISPTAIEWAKEKAAKEGTQVRFSVGDVLDLRDYPDNCFDLALDGHWLHCIIGKDRARFFASVLRILKPGGSFLVYTMCGEVTNPEIKGNFDAASRYFITNGIARRYIGMAEDIRREIEKVGFSIRSWEVRTRKDEQDQDDLIVLAFKGS
jgi:ubiquinone/menaquinone biosynthesis C-methylase UbiE